MVEPVIGRLDVLEARSGQLTDDVGLNYRLTSVKSLALVLDGFGQPTDTLQGPILAPLDSRVPSLDVQRLQIDHVPGRAFTGELVEKNVLKAHRAEPELIVSRGNAHDLQRILRVPDEDKFLADLVRLVAHVFAPERRTL